MQTAFTVHVSSTFDKISSGLMKMRGRPLTMRVESRPLRISPSAQTVEMLGHEDVPLRSDTLMLLDRRQIAQGLSYRIIATRLVKE